MSNPQDLLDRVISLMDKHLQQINIIATTLTKDGAKGFTTYDSQVIERYTKLLLAMTKNSDSDVDDLDSKSDEELEALLNERQNNVSDPTSET